MDCLFCKIINKEIPSTVVFENEDVLAFRDIHPSAPTHILFIPKQHIARLDDIKEENMNIMAKLYSAIIEYTKKNDLTESGFKTQINIGPGGGQVVFHLHIHLLSQKVS